MSELEALKTETPNVTPGYSQYNRWTKGKGAARDRINTGIVVPEWMPSFQLAPGAKIFAIGSCFARNVEKALVQKKVPVTSIDSDSDILEIRTNLLTGLLNKYNPISIHQELEWAIGNKAFPEAGFIEIDGKYFDLSLREQAKKGTIEFVKMRRRKLREYFVGAFNADLAIITLGLTETWFDRTTRLALAEVPSPRLLKQYPGRFGCKLLSCSECESILKSIHTLLRKYGRPDLKIIITVSPVALERTFSGQDIIVANMMSKSTLRSAAGAFAAATDGVDYFPSYEAAMISNPKHVWMPDRRNVSDFIVEQIIAEFIHRYKL